MKILIAFCIDALLGDPRYSFHPVRIMGRVARWLDKKFNKGRFRVLKGAVTALIQVFSVIAFGLLVEKLADDNYYFIVLEIFLLYTTIALHDLIKHGLAVYKYLKNENLPKARQALSQIVGRKTQKLSKSEICRGTLESLSENLVDGVTAPLFYGFLFGLPGALCYKMVNTLDSLWGHRNEKYNCFGYVSAKLDDGLNFIPSRLTFPLIIVSGYFVKGKFLEAFKVVFRDGRKHPSPNSGLGEAALAGSLGVVLGGVNDYEGYTSKRARMGESECEITLIHLKKTFFICIMTSITFILLMNMMVMVFERSM